LFYIAKRIIFVERYINKRKIDEKVIFRYC
jgi:hypothetical protein